MTVRLIAIAAAGTILVLPSRPAASSGRICRCTYAQAGRSAGRVTPAAREMLPAEQYRRLSDLITNPDGRDRLREMANDIEADIRRLQSERREIAMRN